MSRVDLESCTVDLSTGEVRRAAEVTRLAPQLTALLAWFVAHPDEVVSRDRLHREVWGFHPGVVSRAADVAMRRLRSQVEQDPSAPRHLLSIRGEGYRFCPLSTASPPSDGEPEGWQWPAEHALVGRDDHPLRDALSDGGIVGLWGPPGVGKTALLRRLGRAWTRGPRRWVSLDDVDGEAALDHIAAALDLSAPEAERSAAVARALSSGPLLLALDGADAALEALLPHLQTWADAPELVVCVTSRERLRLRRARQVAVHPLDPASARALFEARGGTGDARALFDELDGLPLAIELAAARCRVLSPDQLLARMRRRLAVLATRDADVPERHRTLDAALGLSWELLQPAEQRVLVGLASFADATTLEAVEDLLHVEVDGEMVLDVVQRLVDKSLVQPREDERLGLLRPIRAFLVETAPDALADLAEAHAEVVLRYVEPLVEGRVLAPGDGLMRDVLPFVPDLQRIEPLRGELGARATAALAAWRAAVLSPAAHLERLRTALPQATTDRTRASLHAACAYLLVYNGRAEEAASALTALDDAPAPWDLCRDLLGALCEFRGGDVPGARAHLEAVVATLSADRRTRWEMEARLVLSRMHRLQGDLEGARAELHRLRSIADRVGDRNFVGRSWVEFARCSAWIGDHDRSLDEAVHAVEALQVDPPSRHLLDALQCQAVAFTRVGRPEHALSVFDSLIAAARRVDQRRYVAEALSSRAGTLDRLGRDVRPSLEAAHALAKELSLVDSLASSGINLAIVSHREGDLRRAHDAYQAGIDHYVRVGKATRAATALAYVAVCLADLGEPTRAADALRRGRELAGGRRSAVTVSLLDMAEARLEGRAVREPTEATLHAMWTLIRRRTP
jgi:DNA-binding winged helix-turn-helix (wHTH) protein/tetratricopeptide (TPR) repeat protein